LKFLCNYFRLTRSNNGSGGPLRTFPAARRYGRPSVSISLYFATTSNPLMPARGYRSVFLRRSPRQPRDLQATWRSPARARCAASAHHDGSLPISVRVAPPWSPPLRPSPHDRAGRGERNNHNGVVRCRRGLGLASAFGAKRECMDVIEPAPVAGRERGTRFNGSSPWGPWVRGAEYRHGPALRSRPRLPRQIKHMILLIFCFQRVRSGPNVRPVTLLWTRAFGPRSVKSLPVPILLDDPNPLDA
jgi:hypothetical protein